MRVGFARFAARRIAGAVAFVLVVSAAAFTLTHFAPGDATTDLAASGAAPDVIARERARFGLDDSIGVQLAHWVSGVVRGDLGTSSQFGRPVRDLVIERAGATALLAVLALLIATFVGIPLGIIGGATPSHWLARLIEPVSLLIVSIPPLVMSLALLFIAAATGWISFEPGALVLPVLALSLPVTASLERIQAQAAHDAMAAPDLVAGAARGIPPNRLIWIHVARQSLRPVLGVYGIVIGTLFGGSFIVEIVTSWPGLGHLMYDALRGRDIFLVAGCALAGAVYLAVGNVVADLLRAVIDPRAIDAS